MIGFANHYRAQVWIAFQWFDPNCQGGSEPFRTEGWFNFQPGDSSWLNISELADLRRVGSTHFYYYVEAADGAVWAGPYVTNCPSSAFNWCNYQNDPSTRAPGFREIIISNTPDYSINLIPGDLQPTIQVSTEKNQEGGWVTVTGNGYASVGRLHLC
ncbi:MAG TPA: hypothetical protein VKS22_17070 [Candidatus Binataceae bacterium]|nr:hypothetical protein [Candidatus Binataceae bacterium]